MTTFACCIEHPDGYLVWGEGAEIALYAIGADPLLCMVWRLLPWVCYGVTPAQIEALRALGVTITADKYAPSLAYYGAIGDGVRHSMLLSLRTRGD